jgi:hypothetical protein
VSAAEISALNSQRMARKTNLKVCVMNFDAYIEELLEEILYGRLMQNAMIYPSFKFGTNRIKWYREMNVFIKSMKNLVVLEFFAKHPN